ncbi:glycine/D-amino acid oxidase-like deaminating enzyme [Cytobacillus oceanisediminis]|uniref:Glycine/D-amino acid oxidase-like deaminating enzyme n=1 Tax=Cytobacillus oceanisediminis TaxID=665099 RepID=A0A2V3A551_9BACI|nr:FAD-binding oxidoreductase [Cytobacillus oceanisediminis]PWW32143.1 glycine/D-amino acid oxidase-like deaminating enzyme [Cytobacillus oceanisediminis]
MKVVVIGSGIVGSSAAYHLSREGAEVVIIDKAHQGQATAAGAGIVCPWISRVDNQDWYTIARSGALYYPSLISSLKEDGEDRFGFGVVGALAVSSSEEELNEIEQKVHKIKSETPEVGEINRLTEDEARRLFPPLREDLKAVHVTGAARVDGRLLRDALQRAAQKHGAVTHVGEGELVFQNNKVTGVKINGDIIAADSVIITAGVWAKELLAPIGVELNLEPQRGQIAHLEIGNEDTTNWPVVLPQSSHYLVAFDNSKVVVGATRETGSGFDYRLTAAGVKEVLEEALSVAPGLAESTLKEVRIGFRPAGPDILPLLGTVPGADGVVIATGLGASGLTMGPYVGTVAAELALKRETELDLSPYDPLRGGLKVFE